MAFSPKDAEVFFLGDLDVYIDDETLPAFYTKAEKPITFSPEFAEFFEGIPQTLVRKDLTKFGLSISITVMEWTPQIWQLARGGVLDTTDPTYDYIYYGTNYTEPPTHKFRFKGTLRNNKIIEFVILKGKVTEMGEVPTGGTEHAGIPMVIEALKDDSVSDTSKNLAYFRFEK